MSSLSRHGAAFALAAAIGCAMVMPTLLSIAALGAGEFKGVYPLINDDEEHYLTMIREVVDGSWTMGNPYLETGKQGPYTQPFLADLYYAALPIIFGVSVPLAALLNDFFLVFLGVIGLYFLLLRLSGSRTAALGGTAVFFILFLFQFNRPVNPQLSFVLLIAGLHVILNIIESADDKRRLVAQSLLLAALFTALVYIYPFYWMTLGVVYAGLTIVRMSTDGRVRYWLTSWLCFAIPVLVGCIPFILNMLALSASSVFAETVLRNGYIRTHVPTGFLSVAPLVFFLGLSPLFFHVLRWGSSWDERFDRALFLTLVGGGIVLHWQNVATGLALQFSSHFFLVSTLFVVMIGLIVMRRMHYQVSTGVHVTLISALFVPMAYIAYIQSPTLYVALKNIASPQDVSSIQNLAGPLRWIDENVGPTETVYAMGDDYDSLITIYTSANTHFTVHAGIFLASDDSLERRWVTEHFFDEVTYDTVYGNRDIWIDKYLAPFQNKEVRRKIVSVLTRREYPPATLMDQETVERVLSRSREYHELGFIPSLRSLGVDYLLLDRSDARYARVAALLTEDTEVVLAATVGSVFIFNLN